MYAKKAGIVSLPLVRSKSAHFLKKSAVMNCINYTLCVFLAAYYRMCRIKDLRFAGFTGLDRK